MKDDDSRFVADGASLRKVDFANLKRGPRPLNISPDEWYGPEPVDPAPASD